MHFHDRPNIRVFYHKARAQSGKPIAGIYANNTAKAFQRQAGGEYFGVVKRFPIPGSSTTGEYR
jgi:hypothetical protein